jgi:protease-4
VPASAVLVIDLSTPITDKPRAESPLDIVENTVLGFPSERITLHSVTEAVRHAASDDRIPAILVSGTVHTPGLSSGWAALKEVRDALQECRDAGKKIYAFSMNSTERDYYVKSLARPLLIHPAGVQEFNGFAAESLFYGRALDKYGVDIQVARVGKYKSAVEPFVQDAMSPASREQDEKLVGDLYDHFLDAVSRARGLETADLRRLADGGGFLEGRDAVAAGLADRTAYFDEIVEELKALTGCDASDETFEQISLRDYAGALEVHAKKTSRNRIAVVYAEGDIVDGESETDAGGDSVARLLRRARLDDAVKAVVLRVNSPGGSVSASEVILREVRLTGEAKPLVVSMGSLAASGGYWIACCAHEIIAEPNTITGSIGVYGLFPSFKELMNAQGVTADVVKTAPHADLPSPYRPMTEEELSLFQGLVDRVYDEFCDRVSEGRSLERRTVQLIAQGRVWSGTDALDLGLVDALGGLRDAVRSAARRAKLGEDFELVFFQEEKSMLEDFLDFMPLLGKEASGPSGRTTAAGPVQRELQRMARGLHALRCLNDPRGIYARMPYDLTVR